MATAQNHPFIDALSNFPASGPGSGEANTTSNQGGGIGLAMTKSGVDLPFKTLINGTRINITQTSNNVIVGFADIPGNSITGRATGSVGAAQDLTPAQVRTLINVENGAQVNPGIATVLDIDTGTDNTLYITSLGLAGSQLQADVNINSGKAPNATHSGDMIGSTTLTATPDLINNKTQITPAVGDRILITDASNGFNLRSALVDDFLGGGGATSLNDLSDVTIGAPASSSVGTLRVLGDANTDGTYTVINWTPPTGSGATSLNELSDVDIGTPSATSTATLRILGDLNTNGTYNAFDWTPPDNGATSLNGLSDVTIGTATVTSTPTLRVLGDLNEDGIYTVFDWSPPSAGGGEINTSSNDGGGIELALPKSGVDLPFKTFAQGNRLSINDAANLLTFGLADIPTSTITGRVTAGTGIAEDLTPTQVRTLINVEDGAQANTVTKSGTVAATQIATWDGNGPLTGSSELIWNGSLLNLTPATDVSLGLKGTTVLSHVAGVINLNAIAAIDATTTTTIENAVASLPNLSSAPTLTITSSQVSNFDASVSANSAVAANTAKVTNATHTSEVTGATALTVQGSMITNRSITGIDDADFLLFSDTDDSGNLKRIEFVNLPLKPHDLSSHTDVNSTVSSATTRDVIAFDGVDFKPTRRMNWMGVRLGQEYEIGDVVTESGYTGIANTKTSDVLAPQPIGEPFYVSGFDDTPPWSNGSEPTTSSIWVGQRYNFSQSGFSDKVRLYLPEVSGNFSYELWRVLDPTGTPKYENLFSEFIPDANDDIGWITFATGRSLIQDGVTFDIILIIKQKTIPPTTFNGDWDYTASSFGAPATGEANQDFLDASSFRIHKTDNNSGDRSAELAQLESGDSFVIDGITYDILGSTDSGAYFTFSVTPASRASSGIHNIQFNLPGDASVDYVYNTDHYSANTSVQGFFSTNGYTGLVLNQNAYGVDLQVQEAYISDDWDFIAVSADFESGSGAKIGEAPTDGLGYVRRNAAWVNESVLLPLNLFGDVADGIYKLIHYWPETRTLRIDKVAIACASGTATANIRINAGNIGGLASLAVSSTNLNATATNSNNLTTGLVLDIEITGGSSLTDLYLVVTGTLL